MEAYSISNIFEITEPGIVIAIIAIGLMTMSSLVQRATIDKERMKELKKRLKEQQEVIKKASKSRDTKKLQRAQEEMMKLTMENLKQSLRPMMITIIPFILVFGWLKGQYGNAGSVVTLLGYELNWFWWYLLSAIPFSIVLNRIWN